MNKLGSTHVRPPLKRNFLPPEFRLTVWSRLKPYYDNLLQRSIDSVSELEQWIQDRNELEAAVSEAFSWRYVHLTQDSSDERAADLYQYAVEELLPRIARLEDKLNRKMVESPYLDQLDPEDFSIHLRTIRNAVQLFRRENIPLTTEAQLKAKEYGKIISEMTIGVNGKQMTLQQAGSLLEEIDRNQRAEVYHKINQRILQENESIEELFDQLLTTRHQMALNAGFDNFRDYKFQLLGRFDYTVKDCCDFQDSIASEIMPIIDRANQERKQALGVERLRPWDLQVDIFSRPPLRPFGSTEELVDKSVECLNRLDPTFGATVTHMRDIGNLDLESRPCKRPGGYNMQLNDSGVPFIFMNATHSFSDMRTLMHESGHAIHSFLTRHYRLNTARRFPSEVAELAAMAMELLTMDHWDVFFEDPEDLQRAKITQLENILRVLPWIASIDQFQHWVYTHPHHSRSERKAEWLRILQRFSSDLVDQEGLEHYLEYLWHKQLHIFEVPFYYIEYGMAQLGAIAIWKRYREAPQATVADYIAALRLGYTRSIGEIYRTAGISFDFSRSQVCQLANFVKGELDYLL